MDIVSHFFHAESCDIHPNHGDLLGAVWSWAGIKAEHRQKVAELLSMIGSLCPQSSQRKLKLQTVGLGFCGAADQAVPWLRGALPADKTTRKALDELSDLCSYLRVWRIEEHVYIDALMPPTESFHRHLFFQRTNPPCAVGASLALETIIQHSPIEFKSISYRNESGTSFLVCSRGGGGLLRMELVAELWEENIKVACSHT
ncbi:eIF-2-alpha kinase GCN2-like [Melia azedarach]|uniref:EIF-2-alpha kinase GCN2-like n=1 Tax=Melia azedarach TaxID=155640 RepID=A0ACC1YK72_MELAZ|nr:eIF-2-alpha kinase GCN2-like [Melia azedarach]